MRYISIILCLLTFSFSQDFLSSYTNNNSTNINTGQTGFFERFYIYGSIYNYKSIKDKNENLKNNSAGINLVKTLELPFGSNNNIRIDGKAIFENYDKGSEEIFTFNELYVVTKFNDIEFKVGRKYVDFAIAKTYTLLDFISKPLAIIDSDDNEISKQGKDGVTFGYTPSWLTGAEMFFYGYTDEFSDVEPKSQELLIEVRLNNQFIKSRAYSFFNNQDESSLAGSILANINSDTDIYSEIKYKNNEDIDYIIGVKYEAYKNISIIIERAVLKSGSNYDTLSKKFDNNATKLIKHYNNELSGNNYINAFVKYSFPIYPSSIYLSAIRNMDDESSRISVKVDYNQGRIKYYTQIVRNLGVEKSEFYHKAGTKITFQISLNLTDNNTQPPNR
jgi:hypothetical protein